MKMKFKATVVMFFLTVISYAQSDNPVESRIRIDELNSIITKSATEISELEVQKKVYKNLLASIGTDTISSQIQEFLVKDINYVKNVKFNTLDAANTQKVITSINNIEFYKVDFMNSLQIMITQYQENIETQFSELIMIDQMLIQERNKSQTFLYSYDEFYQLVLNEQAFLDYQSALSVDMIKSDRTGRIKRIRDAISLQLNSVITKIGEIQKVTSDAKRQMLAIEAKLDKKSSYDSTIFFWGFPVFILFILALYLMPLWFLYRRQKTDADKLLTLYQSIYGSGLLIEVITVFLLTSTILLLGITDKLSPEILGTLIGGISGYVLGRSFNGLKNHAK